MNQKTPNQKILLLLFAILISLYGFGQQKFVATSSKTNNYCNGTCTLFNVPDLNGNPTAVIFITPVEVNGINLDPHPICAYYNGKQWSVMNTDNSTMPPGSQFEVQYFIKPDEGHFVHVVTQENILKNKSYIDHAGLNDNNKARFRLFQSASPNVRGGGVNKDEVNAEYDNVIGKWYITNASGKTLDYLTGYSISIPEVTVATTINPQDNTPFTPGIKNDNSGQRIFITVVGKAQGVFTGENGSNRIEVTGFEMEVDGARDIGTGQSSGRRQHPPIVVQKDIGPASIQFYKALVTNEQLTTVTLEVYKPSAGGADVLEYKILMTGAYI